MTLTDLGSKMLAAELDALLRERADMLTTLLRLEELIGVAVGRDLDHAELRTARTTLRDNLDDADEWIAVARTRLVVAAEGLEGTARNTRPERRPDDH